MARRSHFLGLGTSKMRSSDRKLNGVKTFSEFTGNIHIYRKIRSSEGVNLFYGNKDLPNARHNISEGQTPRYSLGGRSQTTGFGGLYHD